MSGHDRMEDRLRGAGLPAAADDLRDRVLAAAVPLVASAERATWADRAWFSVRWRVAAAAVLVALIALDRVSTTPAGSGAVPYGAVAVETAQAAGEAAREDGLPGEQAERRARRALGAASRPAPQDLAALGLRR